jgi:hypothetical protein
MRAEFLDALAIDQLDQPEQVPPAVASGPVLGGDHSTALVFGEEGLPQLGTLLKIPNTINANTLHKPPNKKEEGWRGGGVRASAGDPDGNTIPRPRRGHDTGSGRGRSPDSLGLGVREDVAGPQESG